MDPRHLRVLEMAGAHADHVIELVSELGRVRKEHLGPLHDEIFDHFLRCYAALDPEKTPTVEIMPEERVTARPPRDYSETIRGMPVPDGAFKKRG